MSVDSRACICSILLRTAVDGGRVGAEHQQRAGKSDENRRCSHFAVVVMWSLWSWSLLIRASLSPRSPSIYSRCSARETVRRAARSRPPTHKPVDGVRLQHTHTHTHLTRYNAMVKIIMTTIRYQRW